MANPLAPPPLPPVEGLHPIIVHFPIGVLMFAPAFLLLSMLWRSRTREFMLAFLIAVAAGTIGLFAATWSGEAGEAAAKAVPGTAAVLDRHEEFAELARNLFAGVTAIAGILTLIFWVRGEKLSRPLRFGGGLAMLLLFIGPMMVLANAAHEGGRLVHGFGVRAPIAAKGGAASPIAPVRRDDDD